MGSSDRRKLCDSQWKMDPTIWLSLALAVITLSTPTQSTEPRVVCYYTNWSVYRPGTAKYNPQNINPYLCTHLIYAFGGFTKDNTLKPFDKYQDIEKGGYAKFTGLKTYNKKLKTLLAIGGWNEGSSRFSPMVASREKRKEFVRNVIKFLRQNHFDGLDLDWEYPAFRDGGKPKDRENYAKLVKELREEFEKESEKTGKPRLLLTMAVPAGIEYIQKGFDVKTLNQYLDWMNLLTYDYHSAFEPAVNHHSPLYPLEEPNEYSVDNELNIDYTIKYYLENGADPEKLVLGIPTYGRSYTLFNKDAVEIGSPADGPGEQGEATREKGYLAYYEICEALKPKTPRPKKAASDEDSDEDSEEEPEEPWTVMHPNPNAMGPVAYKGNQWVGYDDLDIVKKKAEYVAENGLGGIMFWSIDNDDFRGTCHGKPYPLIEAAKEAYIVRLGSTDNSVTDRPSRASTTVRSTSNRRRNRPRGTTTTAKPASKTTKRNKSGAQVSSTTPSWAINTPEPPTTPDPGSDFKCTDEGFFPHPRDCKKYFWCLDSGPSNLGIVAHQFTCPSGLFFNKQADSCDFARNVPCKKSAATTKAPSAKAVTTAPTTPSPTTRRPAKLNTKSSSLFRVTTTTTAEPEPEEEYEDDLIEDSGDIEAEDPKVIKELIDLIKKVGGVEQLERQLHLSEPVSTDGSVTTTAVPFNKRLYQKVLEKTRSQSKFNGNSISESNSGGGQYSRRGPQNAGLEPSADRDRVVRRDRPQYTTITRSRGSTTTSAPEPEQDLEDIPEETARYQARAAQESRVGTSPKPLQYVNIRRARPLSTVDTADDTASRNALFERTETIVTVGETPDTLDVSNARRESIPEYVTIRRQRPTTEEAVTEEYHSGEVDEGQETALEREISSPPSLSQPQYTSIVRVRSTTTTASPEKESPEPTTVLAVQISSLLNSPSSAEEEDTETPLSTVADVTETEPPTTTTTTTTTTTPAPTTTTTPSTTTTTTTTTTKAPPSGPTRRTIVRRRGGTSTTTTQATPTSSSSQVSPRNYSFVRRRRPLPPNQISDSTEDDLSRRIRSTTPDSREIETEKPVTSQTSQPRRQINRSRYRFQQNQRVDDSVPAAASPISRGQFRPNLSSDEVVSLTPIDVDLERETPSFVPRTFNSRTDRRFRGRTTAATSTTAAVSDIADSEASAATLETRRPTILPRGRNRFRPSSTTPGIAIDQEQSVSSEASIATQSSKRPAYTRFTPRPFSRAPISTTEPEDPAETPVSAVTQRLPTRLPFGRTRASISTTISPLTASSVQARRPLFPVRKSTTSQTTQSTTTQTSVSESDEEEIEQSKDDIHISESALAEKEHDELIDLDIAEQDTEKVEVLPKRRIVIKKLRFPISASSTTTSTTESTATEAVQISNDGRKRFRVIRTRRPVSSTQTPEESLSVSTVAPTPQRIRKIIRNRTRPVEDEPEIIAKSIGSLNSARVTTTEIITNYGEKSKPSSSTIPAPTEAPVDELNEEDKKEDEKDAEDDDEKINQNVDDKEADEDDENETVDIKFNVKADELKKEDQNVEEKDGGDEDGKEAEQETEKDSDKDNENEKEAENDGDKNDENEKVYINVKVKDDENEKEDGKELEKEADKDNENERVNEKADDNDDDNERVNEKQDGKEEAASPTKEQGNLETRGEAKEEDKEKEKEEEMTKKSNLDEPEATVENTEPPKSETQSVSSNSDQKEEQSSIGTDYNSETDNKPEVAIETADKNVDLSENKESENVHDEEEAEVSPATTTTSTTTTKPFAATTYRGRVPYRPPKRVFTSTTESAPPSSRVFRRKFNPGVYTSPATVTEKPSPVTTRRSIIFTRRPALTRTTKKIVEEEEEKDSNEEEFDEPEEEKVEKPVVLVAPNQLFSRRPKPTITQEEPDQISGEEEEDDDEEEEESAEEPPQRFVPRRPPPFKGRVVNSNTFRTTSSTTELPKRTAQNRTSVLNRFGARPSSESKKRVQNVPVGYASPSSAKPEVSESTEEREDLVSSTLSSTYGTEATTETEADDYLSMTESTTQDDNEVTSTDNEGEETTTTGLGIEIDDSTDDFLDFSKETTSFPTTQQLTMQTESQKETVPDNHITTYYTKASTTPTTTESAPETTTQSLSVQPLVKAQYDKLFSVSRVVEVNSKLDKHRLNKKNETTLVEEGKIMVEKKPTVDKIGEVSRYSLIKIYEDEIPIYLTKLGHVYPVENPPDHLIRIDEARNARALFNFADAPRENLIASESMNEAYRHINKVPKNPKDVKTSKGEVEHIPGDDFLKYINDDKKLSKSEEDQTFTQWQFVPAAYEYEKNKGAKQFEIVTPRGMLTEPSTLPLEGLFKTDVPIARRVGEKGDTQPFLVYSASLPSKKEDTHIMKITSPKTENDLNIITFAKGQKILGGPATEQATVKNPIDIISLSTEPPSTTTVSVTLSTSTGPIIEMLTTEQQITVTEPTTISSTTTSEAPTTTEAVVEETTTTKSLLDAKRSKFAFPRRPAFKSSTVTRPPVTKTTGVTKKNTTALGNLNPKANNNKTSFSGAKSRFSANRAQNVPIDVRKKSTKLPQKSFSTEAPKTTTERRLYVKPIRPNLRPAFVPRRPANLSTTLSTGNTGNT